MSEVQERARGRARGRSRGQKPEQTRRPEQPDQPITTPQLAAVQHQQTPVPHKGRATHRGMPLREQKPVIGGGGDGGAAGSLPQLMTGLSVGSGNGNGNGNGNGARGAGRGSSRGRRDDYNELVTRPPTLLDKRGKSGNAVSLLANYYRIESVPDWRLYHYHVDFLPDVESIRIRKALLGVHRETLGRVYLFDGMGLYIAHKLEHEQFELASERKTDSAIITLKIKLTRELAPRDPVCMQIYNIQLRKNFYHLNFQLLGRNFFDMHSASEVRQHGLEVWPGYITSVRQHESCLLMCVDLSFKILRTDTVDRMLDECFRRGNTAVRTAEEMLLGSIVLTRYNNKTYRVDEIDFSSNANQTFKLKNGTDISFIDYYRQHHGIDIKRPNLPLLLSRPKKRDINRGQTEPYKLIPELCTMTGITEETRNDFNAMKDIAKHTRVEPTDRVNKLLAFMKRIHANENIKKDLEGWNMRYSSSLVELQARILQPEEIFQSKQRLDYKPITADWSRDMRGKRLENPIALDTWVIVVSPRDADKATDFVQAILRVGPPMGMRIGRPVVKRLPDDRTSSYITAIKEEVKQQKLQLLMAIVPSNNGERYSAIKKLCCIDNPVPSQVIWSKNLRKKEALMSIATKVVIQLNCKLGGEVWVLPIPVKNIMVVGFDSYHDSSQKGRSVGGIVGSMNSTLTKYHSKVTFQHKHEEMLDSLCVQFADILKSYHKENKCLPERIVFYRDGVGDGQLNAVKEYEVPQLEECFHKLGPDYNPKFAFIVVTKRINTRFFKKAGRDFDNPVPGTVVDTEVTKPERYDFFLVSQSVRQGTVAPTSYNVIHDTTGFQPEHIQRLSYKLTHLYYNWPGTIRVPAPCQYAHKLAFLVGQSLHREPHPALSDRLFYL